MSGAGAAGGRETVGAEAGAEAEHQGGRTATLQMEKKICYKISIFIQQISAMIHINNSSKIS